jgi:hypothetical protein
LICFWTSGILIGSSNDCCESGFSTCLTNCSSSDSSNAVAIESDLWTIFVVCYHFCFAIGGSCLFCSFANDPSYSSWSVASVGTSNYCCCAPSSTSASAPPALRSASPARRRIGQN